MRCAAVSPNSQYFSGIVSLQFTDVKPKRLPMKREKKKKKPGLPDGSKW
jgi:hypothetical protein